MMTYTLSRFIFPLNEKIPILKSKNIYLDNLQSEKEIKFLANILKEILNLPASSREYNGDVTRINLTEYATIRTITEAYTQYLKQKNIPFNETYKDYELLASFWVVIRFEFDEKERNQSIFKFNKSFIAHQESISGTYTEENSSYVKEFKYAHSLGNLIGFLLPTNSDDSDPENIFLSNNPFLLQNKDGKEYGKFYITVLEHSLMIYQLNQEDVSEFQRKSRFIVEAKKTIESFNYMLEEILLVPQRRNTIEYIMQQLKIIFELEQDNRIKWIVSIAIIEVLLTHNPDFNRFNVEDSISKQFKLKLGIILSNCKNNFDYKLMEEKLKDLYKIRSMLAHGDFLGFDKFWEEKLKKTKIEESENDDRFYISRHESIFENYLYNELFKILQTLISTYLNNPAFVEYLKRN